MFVLTEITYKIIDCNTQRAILRKLAGLKNSGRGQYAVAGNNFFPAVLSTVATDQIVTRWQKMLAFRRAFTSPVLVCLFAFIPHNRDSDIFMHFTIWSATSQLPALFCSRCWLQTSLDMPQNAKSSPAIEKKILNGQNFLPVEVNNQVNVLHTSCALRSDEMRKHRT